MRSRLLRRLAGAAITLKSWGVIGLIVVRASGYRGRSWRWSQVFPFSTYLLPASIVLAAIAAARRRWSTAATLLGGAAVITRVLLPRTRPVAQPAIAEPRRLRVMSTNLLLGSADAEGIVALVREYDPDVLALQELSAGLITRLGQAGLFELLPHHVLRAGGRRQDTGLASRYPLTPAEPGLSNAFRAATLTLPGGLDVPLISVHPAPPMPRSMQTGWVAWLAELPAPVGAYSRGVIAGDFNATLDHPQFRDLLALGWRDAARETGNGLRVTWSDPAPLRLTIDHVLVGPDIAVRAYAIDRIVGSDHRALIVTLDLTTH